MNDGRLTIGGVAKQAVRKHGAPDPARRRIIVLSAVLVLASSVQLIHLDHGRLESGGGFLTTWWGLAFVFAVTEICVFHVEIRRETVSFSLAEVPLVLALFYSSPLALVVGRMVGELIVLGVLERQRLRKLVLNLSAFLAECTVAVTVFRLLIAHRSLDQPLAWVIALVAVMVADAVSITVVSAAIRWHGDQVKPLALLTTNAITVLTNTSLAISGALLLSINVAALVLIVVMATLILLAYRSYTSLSQRLAGLQLLYDFTRMMSGSEGPRTVLEMMLTQAREVMRADLAVIHLFGSDAAPAMHLWSRGADTGLTREDHRSRPPRWLMGGDHGEAHVIVAPHGARDPELRALLTYFDADDAIVAPLTDSTGLVGFLAVGDRRGESSTFDGPDGRLFETLTNHAGVALQNSRLIDRLHQAAVEREYESLHDSLTAMPNRVLFQQRLRRALEKATATNALVGVALMDINGFKEVNDTLGHHAGDIVLQEVARRLQSAFGPDTTAARLGGDEFALVVSAPHSIAEVVSVGRRAQMAFRAPFAVAGLTLEVGVSIGLSVFPMHGADAATLVQRADVAMYSAKTSSGDGLSLYDHTRDTNTPRRLLLAGEMRSAIDNGQIVMAYQPKSRMSDGVVTGVEALVRWNHPGLGPIPPVEFVPLAERSGLIQALTDHILRTVLGQMEAWDPDHHLTLAINLSMRNLVDADLPGRVGRLLGEHAVEPGSITFEITESCVMDDPERIIPTLRELAALGVRLSVDDFGTGYSSLSYLQRLPVHEVKIDQSFVSAMNTDPGAASIVRSVIELANDLGLTVVAEGVENQATWDQLAALGCHYAQGYLLSRPLAPAELHRWLLARSDHPVAPAVARRA